MKKLISIICMFVLAFTLVGCKDKTIKMENGVLMTLNEELKANITMNTSAPQLMFNYEGTYNVYETSSLLGYIFTKNDNFKLSKDFENHLKQFKDSYCVVSEIVQEYDEPNAVFGEQRVPLDSNTKSVEYTIVVWDTDGTRYSYMFRSFISGGVRYFAYTYSTGITMSIEVPLIVQNVDGKQQIFMVALPYNTSYKLGANTKINKLLNREEYLEESYHTFDYPSAIQNELDKPKCIQEWYTKHCNGRFEGTQFVFDYLGIKYNVNFSDSNFKVYVA